SITDASAIPAAAAATSGSNGSPATAAPSSTRRSESDSSASSSASAAATLDGTPIAASDVSSCTAGAPLARPSARASGSSDERLHRRELLEQRAHGTVAAIALVLERHRATARERRQRWEDVRKLRPNVVLEDGEAIRGEPSQVLVDCVDENRERQVALELRRR